MKTTDQIVKVEEPQERLWTRRDAAKYHQVCPHTIANWERQGKLTAVRINKRVVRYFPADVTKLGK